MDEDRKKQVAIFRFGVISDFFARDQMERGERERLLADKCAQRWQIPFSNRTRLVPLHHPELGQALPARRPEAGVALPQGQE